MQTDSGLAAVNLTLGYGGTAILQDLTLHLPRGRFTVLLGPNGCGKSTLLRGLAGLVRPVAGEVLLDGKPLARMGAKSAARQIGLLAQGVTAPEGLTVEALVRQGRYPHRGVLSPWRREDTEAVELALARTALGDLRHRLLDRLSGGQRQRAWIAMVLAQSVPILLLDEPTTWLDLRQQIEVLTLMRRLVDDKGLTIVAVLHDLDQAARHADHVVLMKDGRIAAEGAVDVVLRPDLLATVYGVAVEVLSDPATGRPIILPRGIVPA